MAVALFSPIFARGSVHSKSKLTDDSENTFADDPVHDRLHGALPASAFVLRYPTHWYRHPRGDGLLLHPCGARIDQRPSLPTVRAQLAPTPKFCRLPCRSAGGPRSSRSWPAQRPRGGASGHAGTDRRAFFSASTPKCLKTLTYGSCGRRHVSGVRRRRRRGSRATRSRMPMAYTLCYRLAAVHTPKTPPAPTRRSSPGTSGASGPPQRPVRAARSLRPPRCC